ncbi:MAG TPA: hypothetical protein VHM16_01870, partial [Rubrobacteraceae bacterium]|nr:hypothetical protein [Rubrobacteraceae bacterium]
LRPVRVSAGQDRHDRLHDGLHHRPRDAVARAVYPFQVFLFSIFAPMMSVDPAPFVPHTREVEGEKTTVCIGREIRGVRDDAG